MVLYVGRLVNWKGVDRLIRVMASVYKKDPDLRSCLVIGGDGPLQNSLKKLASDLNIEKKVRFMGAINRNQLRELFASCDIYLTLQDLTNLSNSLLEAMAQGRCVVAGDVGGTREVVKDKETGFLVSIHDLEQAASIVYELLSNSYLRCSIGNKARSYAKEHFFEWSDRVKYELNWITEKFSV